MRRGENPKSLANLKLGRVSQGKESHTITISPENWQWLKVRGKPSRTLDMVISMCRNSELVGKALLERAEGQLKRLESQNERLREKVRELENQLRQRENI